MLSQNEIDNLIAMHRRRLAKLRERQAQFGAATDPAILIEIEDLEAKIEALQTQQVEAERSGPGPVSPELPESSRSESFKGVRIGEVRLMGCALRNLVVALSTLLVVGLGMLVLTGQATDLFGEQVEEATSPAMIVLASATPTPLASRTPSPTTGKTAEAEAADGPDFEFSEIIIAAGVTADFEPIEPLFEFTEGITQVHAIFEYQGMSPDLIWGQILYFEDSVIRMRVDVWSGNEAGLFDYVIEIDGEPLAPGEWSVEFYVEDHFVMDGAFFIDAAVTPSPDRTVRPTPSAK